MKIIIRTAQLSDVEYIFDVRTSVNENHLSREEMRQMGMTDSVVAGMITKQQCAWVAIIDEKVVGFSMILPDKGCLFAAFVMPEYEGRGVGRSLIERAEQELFKNNDTIWLETDSKSRAAEFYRRLGWVKKENVSKSDIRLEKCR